VIAAAAVSNVVPFEAPRSFLVHSGALGCDQEVEGTSPVDAAAKFFETWPSDEICGAVDITVVERATGTETFFQIELS
jgi:hypothetical protein